MTGLKELQRACAQVEHNTKTAFRQALRDAGEIVRVDAAGRFARYDARSAATLRTGVTVGRVRVYQARRKTTGRRGDYGALQMTRALLPALQTRAGLVVQRMGRALDEIGRKFERGG